MLPILPFVAIAGALAVVGRAKSHQRAKTGGKKKRYIPAHAPSLRRRKGIHCHPLPWYGEDIDRELESAIIDKGVTDPKALQLMILHGFYDVTDEGETIQWPSVPEDCKSLRMLEERVRLRVNRWLVTLEDEQAEALYEDL